MVSEICNKAASMNTSMKASQGWGLLQKRLNKNMLSPYNILAETERYLAWFIPIVSSIFFILVAASVRPDSAAILKAHGSSIVGFVLFFLSLLSAIFSRFCIFHFNKLRSDFTIKTEQWTMHLLNMAESIVERMERLGVDSSNADEIESLPAALAQDESFQKQTAEIMEHLISSLPKLLGEGFAERVQAIINNEKLRDEMIDKEKAKQTRLWSMKSGWGRWGIISFYLCNILFFASLIAWFVFALES